MSHTLVLNVAKITVLHRLGGPDVVVFEMVQESHETSPFPEMDLAEPGQYPPNLRVECRRGYAATWLKNTFGLDAEDFQTLETG